MARKKQSASAAKKSARTAKSAKTAKAGPKDGDGGGPVGGAAQPQQPQQPLQGAQLSVLGQFVKDLSFESPNAPKSLQGPGENPKLNVNVNVQAAKQGENVFEVALNFEASATSDSGTIYNVELVYAGMFRLTNIPDAYLQPVLFIDCPTILFPYLRRIVSEMTQEGGFPPLLLDPIDFAGLFRQNAQKAQAGQGASQAN